MFDGAIVGVLVNTFELKLSWPDTYIPKFATELAMKKRYYVAPSYGAKYSRMDQVKFVEDSL